MAHAPIGVFDSGFGGLTVAREILDQLPQESVLYLGDTARTPYGPRPIAQVRQLALECLDRLVEHGVKALVIACNSASAAVLADARERYDVPVVEVIRPAVRRAVAVTRSGRIGVISTEATHQSRAYVDSFVAAPPHVEVFSQPCPRFVELVEAGITSGPEVVEVARDYLAPLQEEGIDTLTTFPGPSPMDFEVDGEVTPVRNFRDISFGVLDLRVALAESVNTIYVQLNEQVGPERTVRAAVDLGLPEDTPGLGGDLTNVLGTASPTLVEMTNAYATLAAEGRRADPYLVASVVDATGESLYEADPETTEAIDPDVAADVTDAMTYVMSQGSGMTAGDLGRPSAGKSGTSENNVSAWFDGYVPQLAAGVVMYKGDGTVPMQQVDGLDQVTGGTFPAQVWGEFMRRALEGEEVIPFPERVGVGEVLPTTQEPTEVEPTTQEPPPTSEEPTETTSEEPTETTSEEPTETTSEEPTDSPEPTTPPTGPEPTTPDPTTPEPTTLEPTTPPPSPSPPPGEDEDVPAPTG